MHIVTQGIVLREVNYKEADKILTVMTAEGGKRTVKARGCRRKGSALTAATQLLVYSDMTLFEYKDYYTLNEAGSLEQFWGIKGDLELLALSSYLAEVMEAVAEEGRADGALLALILNSLYALDKLKKPPALVKAAYELRLMCLAGYEPLLDACAVCGVAEPIEPLIHLEEGVLVCARCRGVAGAGTALPLTGGALEGMRRVVYGDPKRLFSFQVDEDSGRCLTRVCELFLLKQLDRGFRTLDFYKELMV